MGPIFEPDDEGDLSNINTDKAEMEDYTNKQLSLYTGFQYSLAYFVKK